MTYQRQSINPFATKPPEPQSTERKYFDPYVDPSVKRSPHIITLKDLFLIPPLKWWKEGLIAHQAITEIHGPSGVGKTFFAIDIALNLSQETNVLYLIAEGLTGYPSRVDAWEQANKKEASNIFFYNQEVNLISDGAVDSFIELLRTMPPSIIFIDTLARCMVGAEENSARDMGKVINNCDRIIRELDCSIVLIHHTGKSGSYERGSSALRGACFSMIELTRIDDDLIRVSSSKLKDGLPFEDYYLKLVALGESMVVQPTTRNAKSSKEQISKNERKILEMLSMDIYREAGGSYSRISGSTELASSSTDRALDKLKQAGYIKQSKKGEPYYITEEGIKILNT